MEGAPANLVSIVSDVRGPFGSKPSVDGALRAGAGACEGLGVPSEFRGSFAGGLSLKRWGEVGGERLRSANPMKIGAARAGRRSAEKKKETNRGGKREGPKDPVPPKKKRQLPWGCGAGVYSGEVVAVGDGVLFSHRPEKTCSSKIISTQKKREKEKERRGEISTGDDQKR